MLLDQNKNQNLNDSSGGNKKMGWIADAVSGVIQGVASPFVALHEGHKNRKAQREANEANIALQRETNAHNEALQREQWEREDTALQRHVADAQAAGVSPIGNVNGSPSSLSTNMVAPTVDPVTSGDMARAIGDSLSGFASLLSGKSERQKDRDQSRLLQNEQFNHAIKTLKMQIASTSDEKEKDRLNALQMSCNQLQQQALEEDYKVALELERQFQESVKIATGGLSVSYYLVDDYERYKKELKAWNDWYYMTITSEVPQYSSETSSGSSSVSTSASGKAFSIGAGASNSQSQSTTSSVSNDVSNTPYYKLRSLLLDHPKPEYDRTGILKRLKQLKGGKK